MIWFAIPVSRRHLGVFITPVTALVLIHDFDIGGLDIIGVFNIVNFCAISCSIIYIINDESVILDFYSPLSETIKVSSPHYSSTWLKGSAVLVVLLGLTWTFGFVYVNADTVAVAYLFTILNSLQGLFIFIFHCFMDRKYFIKFWSSRKRKRSSTSSATGKQYCQHALQVTNEKKNYSSGEEDSDVDDKDNISISKDRLSLLSKESMPKLNADFTSDNEEGKVNYAVLQEGKTVKMAAQTESERALFNDLLSMYKTMDGKNEALIPTVRVCTSHQKLESGEGLGCEKGENKDITKSAPNLKAPTFSAYSNQTLDTTSEPLLGSMPDVAVAVEHQEFIEE
ncbi:AGRL3-like protein [Mya arenaria]|uniref:AGRL3-like protein n=1 Tax=Mya arenaria TaxID=6604 RepID=A0ABY7FPW2_MYAAR|nr:AGRL3-like protein [Mya arenaria]